MGGREENWGRKIFHLPFDNGNGWSRIVTSREGGAQGGETTDGELGGQAYAPILQCPWLLDISLGDLCHLCLCVLYPGHLGLPRAVSPSIPYSPHPHPCSPEQIEEVES